MAEPEETGRGEIKRGLKEVDYFLQGSAIFSPPQGDNRYDRTYTRVRGQVSFSRELILTDKREI